MLQPKEIIARVRRDFKRHSDIKWYYYTIPFVLASLVLWDRNENMFGYSVFHFGLKGLIITSLIIAALSWFVNLGGRFDSSFRDILISFYKKDNPDWEKEAVQEAGEKIAYKYYDVFAWIQIRAVLGMVVFCFLQLLLLKPFVLVLSLTSVVLDFLFVFLISGNIILYYYFKKAVAHVVYSSETGQDSEPAVRIEKQDNTGSYQK